MRPSLLQEIAQIIERDSKDTTYKFALLRGTIEVIQARSPYIEEAGDRMRIPLGLLVERWLLYYYPIIAADGFIPQKNGEKDRHPVSLGGIHSECIRRGHFHGGSAVVFVDRSRAGTRCGGGSSLV